MINGYWENWVGALNNRSDSVADPNYYKDDFKAMTHIFYSFLTLAKVPNPDEPQKAGWDGLAIYESMTQANIMDVMKITNPPWANDYNW